MQYSLPILNVMWTIFRCYIKKPKIFHVLHKNRFSFIINIGQQAQQMMRKMCTASFLMLRYLVRTLPNFQLALCICLCINIGQISLSQALPLNTYDSTEYNETHTMYNSLSSNYELSYNGSNNHLSGSFTKPITTVSSTTKPMGVINGSLPMILVSQVTPVSIQTKPKVKPRDRLLKCHCDICKDNNNICETDGYCFTSVQKETSGALIFSYRCLDKKYDLQREPLECLTSKQKQNIYKVQCCHEDFCNKNELLKLSFSEDACL